MSCTHIVPHKWNSTDFPAQITFAISLIRLDHLLLLYGLSMKTHTHKKNQKTQNYEKP